jgi:hypothetical protein
MKDVTESYDYFIQTHKRAQIAVQADCVDKGPTLSRSPRANINDAVDTMIDYKWLTCAIEPDDKHRDRV